MRPKTDWRERIIAIIQKTARVTAVHRERFELLCEGERLFAKLKSGVFADSGETVPTTGDYVDILFNPSGDSQIVKTLPRTSVFYRKDADKKRPRGQAVAANFEHVFIMASLNQDFNLRRLERYLALAWQSGASPVVVLTKADLSSDWRESADACGPVAMGVPVHAVSALTGQGLAELEQYLGAGKTIVLLGSSGVGKSSLLNALAGENLMEVKQIREDDGKGRHTTTHRQLIGLASGAFVIDTPGMRELGMWDAREGVSGTFADIEQLLPRCRFSNCRHQTEPGCAVLEAIESGALTRERWLNYQKLKREALYTENRAAAMLDRQQRNKSIARYSRARRKTDKQ